MAEQLSFPQPRVTSYAAHDFFPGTASETARSFLANPDTWPLGKLILVGPEGSGKTHLLHIWAKAQGAEILGGGPQLPARAQGPVAVDDAHLVAGDRNAEEALFHLHNNLAAEGFHLLLAAPSPPGAWGIALPDLKSRMEGTTSTPIGRPDDATLTAIILKLMSDRQLSPAPDVVPYLVRSMVRSYTEAGAIVAALDALAMQKGKGITRQLATELIAGRQAR